METDNACQINKISLELDDLLLPYTFDLSIYHHITALDLIAHIERAGKVFIKKKIGKSFKTNRYINQ